MELIELTLEQKLKALALKYYQNYNWSPKKGDYYTSSRDDLDLYKITNEDDKYFYTEYCDPKLNTGISQWPKETFLQDFGVYRVYVPGWILTQ